MTRVSSTSRATFYNGVALLIYTVVLVVDTFSETDGAAGPLRRLFPGVSDYGMGVGAYFYFGWCAVACAYAAAIWVRAVRTRSMGGTARIILRLAGSTMLMLLAVLIFLLVGYSSGMSH